MLKILDHEIPVTIFPDNSSQVWKLPDQLFLDILKQDHIQINWFYNREAEVVHLFQLVELLRSSFHKPIDLYVPYLPFARQDKPVSNTSTFALTTFFNIIKPLEFRKIESIDAHGTRFKYPSNFKSSRVDYSIETLKKKEKIDLIVYPDDGAYSRYSKYRDSVTFYKERNQLTGEIIKYKMVGEVDTDLENTKLLVVDDLCDGGGTFIKLAESIKDSGYAELNLYVTHGLFTHPQGTKPLHRAGYTNIFTFDKEYKYLTKNGVKYV